MDLDLEFSVLKKVPEKSEQIIFFCPQSGSGRAHFVIVHCPLRRLNILYLVIGLVDRTA